MSEVSGNGVTVRIANLERAVNRLETLEPAVVKQQVSDLREGIVELRQEISRGFRAAEERDAATRKILITFLVGSALALLTTALTLLQGTVG